MAFLPIDASTSCFRRARRFLELADKKVSVSRVKNDLRRMALVMAVAALDSYLHALVLRRIANVRRSSDLPKALARVDIAFGALTSLADSSIAAQRVNRQSRPWVQVKASLQNRLFKETFQSYDQVATALSYAGIEKAWTKIAKELGETAEANKSWLNALVHRRNQIVHEGDLKRASRPRHLQFNEIDHANAVQDVDWMEELVNAIELVVAAHP